MGFDVNLDSIALSVDSQEKFQAVYDLLPVGILLVDAEGRILSANQYCCQLFGYATGELVGINVDRLVPSHVQSQHAQHRERYRAKPKKRQMAENLDFLEGVGRDGRAIPLEIGLAPLELEGQKLTLVSVLNISERKQLLDELQTKNTLLKRLNTSLNDSEVRLRTLYELLPVGVMLIDQQGVIANANNYAHQLFGYEKGRLEGLNVDCLVPDSTRSHHAQLRDQYRQAPKQRRMAANIDFLQGCRRDGSQVALEIGLAPLSLENTHYTLVSVLDIDERKQLIDELKIKNQTMDQAITELRQSNEQLERFAYVCSHDLQEPVRMVQSFAQLLGRRLGEQLGGKDKEYLAFITEGADRARAMISDVLQYCRLDQPLLAREPVALEAICQQVHETLRSALAEKQATFVWSAPLPQLFAVPSQLFQVILNLVSNGIKFNHSATPRVCIQASAGVEGRWLIRVEDNGIGIAEKYHQQIFSIFERLHSKKDFPGTGIGLATCAKIAQQHTATIRIVSEDDQGATFILDWPGVGEESA